MSDKEKELNTDLTQEEQITAPAEETPKKKKRKKKETVEAVEIEPTFETVEVEEVVVEEAPAVTETPMAAAVETRPEAIQMEETLKQWSSLNLLTQTLTSHFEKLIERIEKVSTQEQKIQKNRINPFIFSISIFAVLFSIFSLILAQSARQAILTQISTPAISMKVERKEPKEIKLHPKKKIKG